MKPLTLHRTRPLLPAAIVAVLLALLWAYTTHSRELHEPSHAAFALWLALLFLLDTLLVILWTATVDIRPRAAAATRTFLAYALLSDLSGLLLLFIGVLGGIISLLDLCKLYLLLISWLGLWTSITGTLRRFGTLVAALLSLALALPLLAAPILWSALQPLTSLPPVWQSRLATTAAAVTPLTATLDALHNALHLAWSNLPPFLHPGANLDFPLPPWWLSATIYAALGLLLYLLRRPWNTPAPSLTRP
ncbi:MAG: hypothetical protein ACTHN5_03950 [Phycisphaerae bacterium]